MTEKFNPDDNITSEQLFSYLKYKGMLDSNDLLKCSLCSHHSFTYTDTGNLFPSVEPFNDSPPIKYRLSLVPSLIKPKIYYSDLMNVDKNKENALKFPVDAILKNDDVLETFIKVNSRDMVVMTCNHCGNTIFIDREKIVEFLMKGEYGNE
ncbi:hypothetical protein [Gallibacterium anatis]|uniref:Uncharacterized protein n=1 Tax=Gallibacterium anatis TaxID=750 RepID=A0A1A7PC64_9PAST|nr:hypothetical protein [Gallibacterium anatis]OBW97175.1 hypothetical protein QV02_01645 [Gallibacterium anatis]OBW99301.1 hypothetical protein QV03_03740 [Gallibacterium anatis]